MTPAVAKTTFLGIGVPPRPTRCPQCKKAIEVDSEVYYFGDNWLRYATFFCSEACLLIDPKLEDETHHDGNGQMLTWAGSGGG